MASATPCIVSAARSRARAPPASRTSRTNPGLAVISARFARTGSSARVHVPDEVLLAVDAAPGRRAALGVDLGDLLLRRVEEVEREEVAGLRVARVGAPRAPRVGDHRHDLRPHLLRRVRERDRVAVALRHLPAVEPGDLRRRREEGLRLGEDLAVHPVEAPDDLAADLEVALLVLPHRHVVRPGRARCRPSSGPGTRGSRTSRAPSPAAPGAAPCRSAPARASRAA